MQIEHTFIAPDIIRLREAVKKLSTTLEARPKLPANATPGQLRINERFYDLQARMGGGITLWELEIDKMLSEL